MIQLRIDKLQPLGRALMLPIAVLPIAGLLLRLGQADLLNVPFVAAAGDAIFSHLGLLFGIGVAVGLARENHGAAGLAGAVCFFVLTEGAKALLQVTPDATAGFTDQAARDLAIAAWRTKQLDKLSVPAGILSGVAAGMCRGNGFYFRVYFYHEKITQFFWQAAFDSLSGRSYYLCAG